MENGNLFGLAMLPLARFPLGLSDAELDALHKRSRKVWWDKYCGKEGLKANFCNVWGIKKLPARR